MRHFEIEADRSNGSNVWRNHRLFGILVKDSTASSGENIRVSFETTALQFANPLYRSALRLTRRPEDAVDLVQETYLRAYRTFSTSLLERIARRGCLR